jgi:hypothetical protein
MMTPLWYPNDIGESVSLTTLRDAKGCNEELHPASSALNNNGSTLGKRRSTNMQRPSQDEAVNQANNLTSINSGFLAVLGDDLTQINMLTQHNVGSNDCNYIVGEEDHQRLSSLDASRSTIFSSDTNHQQITARSRNFPPIIRTVSPSIHSMDMPIVESKWDPLHLLEPISCSSTGNASTRPVKKSRISMINVPSLTGLQQKDLLSCFPHWNLTERSSTVPAQSQLLLSSSVGHAVHDTATSVKQTLNRETSLSRLFSHVSFLDSQFSHIHNNPPTVALSRLAKVPTFNKFPVLPGTISESFCDALRRHSCDSLLEANRMAVSRFDESSSFGWFVDTDDDHDDTGKDCHANSTHADGTLLPYRQVIAKDKTNDLAFHAPTAPKGRSVEDDADIEWAQAADTVDSVLGGVL